MREASGHLHRRMGFYQDIKSGYLIDAMDLGRPGFFTTEVAEDTEIIEGSDSFEYGDSCPMHLPGEPLVTPGN
jgi:hypothetical protein